jgi:cytidylate kinase
MTKQLSEGLTGLVRLVERQMLLHEERSKLDQTHAGDKKPGPYRFITISRDIGALGDAVASELAETLQWKVYDKEIVDRIVTDSHARRNLVEQLDEKTQSRVHDSVERLLMMFQGQNFSNDEYHIALIKTLAVLAAQERCIILGHGGVYALQEQAGLHVRITASLPVRVQRMSRRWNLSSDQTRRIVLKTDRDRRDFVQHHFSLDREDLLSYFHLIFNTDWLTVDCVVAAILGILEKGNQPASVHPPVFDSFAFQNSEQIPG